MVDDIDKESTREELYAIIDSLRHDARVLCETLRAAPAFPSPYALKLLSRYARYPEDNEVGRALRQKFGIHVVPAKFECEAGAGFWMRLIGQRKSEDC